MENSSAIFGKHELRKPFQDAADIPFKCIFMPPPPKALEVLATVHPGGKGLTGVHHSFGKSIGHGNINETYNSGRRLQHGEVSYFYTRSRVAGPKHIPIHLPPAAACYWVRQEVWAFNPDRDVVKS